MSIFTNILTIWLLVSAINVQYNQQHTTEVIE